MHWWIAFGLVCGVLYGYLAAATGSTEHVSLYIAPIGRLFLSLLKMIAVPLVLFSLVAGVASLNDTSKLGRIGGKAIGLYLATTAVAICLGLLAVNIFAPGTGLADATRDSLIYSTQAATDAQLKSPDVRIVDQLVDIVPTNPFAALAGGEMLQIVFFSLMLGIALTKLASRVEGTSRVVQAFQTLSDATIVMVQMSMKIAPIGVFAMMAGIIADLGRDPHQLGDLLSSLGGYMGTVVIALFAHYLLVYTAMLKLLTHVPWLRFAKTIVPAQLLAFSSSSSLATLPVTIRCVEELGVDEEVSSFVLPLGATLNMDGTGLYQGVAAVFIANALGYELGLGQQLAIVLTGTLASIGTAGVPGVGIIMLVIVLKAVGVPEAGIGLILAVDRPIDMCRTVLNVTGDAVVATVVASSEGLIHAGERHHRA
jgi:proton glutamate symport protein